MSSSFRFSVFSFGFWVFSFLVCIALSSIDVHAQIQIAPDRYRVEFTDKNHNSFSIDNPTMFLSERALQRRANHGIEVTQVDLPVSFLYIDSLKRMGFEVLNTSRWFNSATIRCLPEEIEKLNKIDFVKQTFTPKKEVIEIEIEDEEDNDEIDLETLLRLLFQDDYDDNGDDFEYQYVEAPLYYGGAAAQIGMLNGQALHERGFRGQGMFIAVIDGGFFRANELSGFDSLRTAGRFHGLVNFTPDSENPFGRNSHGTNVLSILATCLPGKMIGSAPEADYILLRSEEIEHEYRVEEDNWIAAVEYADSIGVDLISCSLGYTTFDDFSQNHNKDDLDGRTVRTSRAATMAAARGMIVCISAGNSGNDDWGIISVPADADSIVAVGAVYLNGRRAEFSSVGPAADNRIKPDLMAIGARTAYQNSMGSIVTGSGTSYSTPVIAGLIACLWQANKDKTNMEIIEMVKRTASHFDNPDTLYGYGIPDFSKLIGEEFLE